MSTYEIGDETRAWLKFSDNDLREFLADVFGVDATGWTRDRMVAEARAQFRRNAALVEQKEREMGECLAREEAKG
jgi:hypothetical protein